MRHTNPKYSINQLVTVEFVGVGIIKGMQLKPSLDNSGKFTTDGWEYSVWRQVEGYPGGFQDCGWVMLQTSTSFYLLPT